MSSVWTVARKEIRGTFQSPVAVIFLGVFLIVTLFSFFSFEGFFARNLTDVRPLFEWLPILLIFLVSAITMRQWAEEQRVGTLEVLLTLPIKTWQLVLGKFVAGMVLVAIALLLTAPLPLSIAQIGDLDWGPVFGGYMAALLLASAYMSIGLCVSSRTDNQVVALMVTLVIGGLLYLVGTETVVAWFGSSVAEIMRGLGSGSRFESIQRGVLDVRDLAYYLSVSGFFVALNVYFLERRRLDLRAESGGTKNAIMLTGLALIGLNVLFGNAWLHPLARLRVDLTERGEYSISTVTKDALQNLDEPLVISGYFSERTHELLSPLTPQVRDFLEEYEIYGGGKVTVEFADPTTNEELEQELNELYGIRSVAFPVQDRNQQAIVNAYFHILVRYGDKYEVLGFDDLIEVDAKADGVDVRIRNLEYDMTRTIRKVSQEFLTLEAILAKVSGDSKLTLYLSESTIPEDFGEMADKMRKVSKELADASGGRLTFSEVDPSVDTALQEQLYTTYGIQPLAVDLFGRQVFWAHVLLEVGDRVERMSPPGDVAEAEIREALEAAIKRAAPGQVTRVGIFSPTPVGPPPNPNIPPQYQPPPPRADYTALEEFLAADFQVERVDLVDGKVPEDIEVLLAAKTGALTDQQSFALDQFLMRGGKLIALAGQYAVDVSGQALAAKPNDGTLAELLASYGVTIEDKWVMDPQNAPFPIPVNEQIGGMTMQRIEMIPYPFFADVRSDGMAQGHAALMGLNNVTVPWASPLAVEAPEGVTSQVLLQSSEGTWLRGSSSIDPDFTSHPQLGFAPSGDVARRTLAVALSGTFPSAWADKPSPVFDGEAAGEAKEGEVAGTGRTLKTSLPDAKLVVVGSSELLSDIMVSIGTQLRGGAHLANAQLVQNLMDWSVEDTELAQIRSSGAFARTLHPLSDEEKRNIELLNYGVILFALAVVVTLPRRRRTATTPLVSLKEVSA